MLDSLRGNQTWEEYGIYEDLSSPLVPNQSVTS